MGRMGGINLKNSVKFAKKVIFLLTFFLFFPVAFAQLGPEIFVDNGTEAEIVYANISEKFFVVYAKFVNRYDIYGRIYDKNLNPLTSPFVIKSTSGDEDFPDVASNGTDFFVVWRDYTNQKIYGRYVSRTGSLGTEVLVANVRGKPAVAYGDGKYLVYYASGGCWGKIFDKFGNVVVNNFLLASDCGAEGDEVGIAFGNGRWVISSWRSTSPYGILIEVYPNGTTSYHAGYDWSPSFSSIAFGLNRFEVIGQPLPWESRNRVKIFVFDNSLNLITQFNLPSYYDVLYNDVDIAFGGNKFFAIWMDECVPPGDERKVLGREIYLNNTYGSLIIFPRQYFSYRDDSLAFGNNTFAVTWTDYRSKSEQVYLRPYYIVPEALPVDTEPPKWVLGTNSTNSTSAGKPVLHSLKWTDNVELSGYIFSFDNCTGYFVNDTWVSAVGNETWTNVTKIINSTVGCTIRWRVYANDSSNNWNASDIFSYVTTPPIYTLRIESSPSGITFTLNGASKRTPYFEELPQGTYQIIMPPIALVYSTYYQFDRWSDGATTNSRTIYLDRNINLTAYYVPTPPPNFCGEYGPFAFDRHLFNAQECVHEFSESYYDGSTFYLPCYYARKICEYDSRGNLKECWEAYNASGFRLWGVTSNGTHVFALQGSTSIQNFTVFVFKNKTLVGAHDITSICYQGSAYEFCKAIDYRNGRFYVTGEIRGTRICPAPFPIDGRDWYYCNDNLYIFNSNFNLLSTKSVYRGNGLSVGMDRVWISSTKATEFYVYDLEGNLVNRTLSYVVLSGALGLAEDYDYFYVTLTNGSVYRYLKEGYHWCFPDYECYFECDCDNYFGDGYGRQFKVCRDKNECYKYGQPACPPYIYKTNEWIPCKSETVYICEIPYLDFPPPNVCQVYATACLWIAINGNSSIATDSAFVQYGWWRQFYWMYKPIQNETYCIKEVLNATLKVWVGQINPYGSLNLSLVPYPYEVNLSYYNPNPSICHCDYETSRWWINVYNCSDSYIFGCTWAEWNITNWVVDGQPFNAYIYNYNPQVTVLRTDKGPHSPDMPRFCANYVGIASNVTKPPPTPPIPPAPVCKICEPAELGSLGIVCMIVNIFFCNPVLIFILVLLIIFSQLRKKV